MKLRRIKVAPYLGLPIVLGIGLWGIKQYLEQHSLLFSVIGQEYEQSWSGRPGKTKNIIWLETHLACQFGCPSWWQGYDKTFPSNLVFSSALMTDSQKRRIRLDEIESGEFVPQHNPSADDFRTTRHVSILRPRGAYDLSQGGKVIIRMTVPSRVSDEPYWEGEIVAILPPTHMQPSKP